MNIGIVLVIILITLVAVFGVFLFLFKIVLDSVKDSRNRQDELSRSLTQSLSEQNKTFVSVLQRNTSDLNARLDKAAVVIQGVQRNLGEMSEIGRSMKDLQEYLKSPKLRGNIGEEILAEVLKQMLPKDMYSLQYTFKNGEKVDSVIRIGSSLLAVDAKFPVENFRAMNLSEDEKTKKEFKKEFIRDVKKHLDDISRKYILPEEGTLDYALMYIPSEGVYYEVINDQTIFDYCTRSRVLVVSPMSFYAYLKAVLMSLQGQSIQKQAREILNILNATQKDYEKIEEALAVLEKHFSNAYGQLQNVSKFFSKLGQKLSLTKLLEDGTRSKEPPTTE